MGGAALVAAFAMGVAAGWVGRGSRVGDVSVTTRMEAPGDAFERIDLEPEQRVRVDSILGAFQSWSDSVFSRSEDVLTREATRTHQAILAVLDPAQRERYLAQLDSAVAVVRIRRVRVSR